MSELPPGPAELPVDSLALVILDGWGLTEPGPGNAVSLASTPTFDELWETRPHTQLSASGRDVGLPEGQMGNSEVGHLNLGAGSVVKQDLARIDDAVADGSFFENEVLVGACERARSSPRGRLHLIGLVSDGGVHSGWEHIEACIELAANEGVPDLVLHAFTDGRDTSPTGGAAYLEQVDRWLRSAGRVGTLGGRFFGMDRDRRWERIEQAYEALVRGEGERATSAAEAIERAYAADVTDEFMPPTVIGDYDGMASGDVVLTFNFRPDRMREITAALGDPKFGPPDGFARGVVPELDISTMASYREEWTYPVAFPPTAPATTIAEVISDDGGRQLHVAETEKYAHVTYFFNGGREKNWDGEQRRLVDSARDVPTYDHKPEMSAPAAADAFCSEWEGGGYRFGIINFANPDMVGHTGDVEAAVEAIETVDACLAKVIATVHRSGGACIVTADHGNAEYMIEPDGAPHTAHTTNPVPLIVTVEGLDLRDGGILADVSPTALDLLGIERPEGMNGRTLRA